MRTVALLKQFLHTKYGRIAVDFSLITIVGIVIFRNLLFWPGWPAGNDILGWISREYLFGNDLRWIHVWRPHSFGFVETIHLTDLFFMLTYILCKDAAVTIKVFLFSSFLTAGFSMYAFSYRLTRHHVAALAASLVYTLNQWFFSQFTEGHVWLIFSYAFVPLVFLLLDKALTSGKIKNALFLAIGLLVLITGFHPQSTVIYWIFLSLFILFYLMFPTESISFNERFRRVFKIALPTGVGVFLLSAFVVGPLMFNTSPPYFSPQYRYSFEEARDWSHKNVTEAFTLRAVESGGYKLIVDVYSGLGFSDFPIYVFLLFLFLLSYCTIFLRWDRYAAFFLVSALICVFISKGPNPPFGEPFKWAWFNIPYFAILRRPPRLDMMTAFSHSFFISILVVYLTKYVQKGRHLNISKLFFKVEQKVGAKPKTVEVTFNSFNKILRRFSKFLWYFSLIMLVSIPLSGFLSCWFFFSQGLQTYTPPESCLEPFEWIAEQNGDYKIVTVSRSPQEWLEFPSAEIDFGFSRMLTDIGWGHDIGYDSSFIHDKPVLQDGGWAPLSHAFVDYLRLRLAQDYMTDDLLKMLGAFNYKFVVLPPYTTANMRNFFENQQGACMIYNQSGSLIIMNDYYTPHLFPTTNYGVVVGGLQSFPSLHKIDTFALNQNALIFAHQLDNSELFPRINSSEALIFVDSSLLDMVMLSLKDYVSFFYAAEYGVPSTNSTKYWVPTTWWKNDVGAFVIGGDVLTALGKTSISIPIQVTTDEAFDIWIRVGFAPQRGNLSVLVDDVLVGEICPDSDYWSGLKWVNITRLGLGSGNHVITFINDGTGYNDIDSIAIVEEWRFESRMNEVLDILKSFEGRLVYILEAENTFSSPDNDLSWNTIPYNGVVLHSDGRSNMSARVFIPREGNYMFAARACSGPNYGNLNMRVNSVNTSINCSHSETMFKWHEFGPIYLNASEQTISISSNGEVDVDEIVFYSLKENENTASLDQLFKSEYAPPSISYERIDPTRYNVRVNATEPFLLIFSDSYHPLWKAYVDSLEVSPTIAYSFVNGFFINKTGDFNVKLYFTGQTYADLGLRISAVTLVVLVVILITPSKVFKRLRDHIGRFARALK